MYTIEKNVPIPSKFYRTGFTATLRAMEVGDSVLVPPAQIPNCRSMMYQAKRATGRQFTGQSQPDHSMRIWRVK